MLKSEKYRAEVFKYAEDNVDLLKAFSDKKIIITGAAGLIGTYIVDIFLASNEINNFKVKIAAVDRNESEIIKRFDEAIDNSFFEYYITELSETDIPDMDADFIIHAASNTSPIDYAQKPIDTILCNAMGSNRLLEYCVRNKIKRFVFCSSVEAYGTAGEGVEKFTEEYSGYVNSNSLRAAYPSSKRLAESLCNAYNQEYGVDFCIGRIGRIFGPTVIEGDAKAPTQFIMNAVNKEDIVLKSDGMQLYSYGYVGDCAVALIMILAHGECGQAYNISSEDLRLRDFALICAKSAGKELVFQEQSLSEKKGYSNITRAVLDVSKLKALGFIPEVSVQDGINQTVEILGGLFK